MVLNFRNVKTALLSWHEQNGDLIILLFPRNGQSVCIQVLELIYAQEPFVKQELIVIGLWKYWHHYQYFIISTVQREVN